MNKLICEQKQLGNGLMYYFYICKSEDDKLLFMVSVYEEKNHYRVSFFEGHYFVSVHNLKTLLEVMAHVNMVAENC